MTHVWHPVLQKALYTSIRYGSRKWDGATDRLQREPLTGTGYGDADTDEWYASAMFL